MSYTKAEQKYFEEINNRYTEEDKKQELKEIVEAVQRELKNE